MPTEVSETVQKILGIFIEEEVQKKSAFAWVQDECRRGQFSAAFRRFEKSQVEDLNIDRLVVEDIDNVVLCRIPGTAVDHEGKSPIRVEVWAELDPVAKKVKRAKEPQ